MTKRATATNKPNTENKSSSPSSAEINEKLDIKSVDKDVPYDGGEDCARNDGNLNESDDALISDNNSEEISGTDQNKLPNSLNKHEHDTLKKISSRTSHSATVTGKSTSSTNTYKQSCPMWTAIVAGVIIGIIAIYFRSWYGSSKSSTDDIEWRSKVDPNNNLSNEQQAIVRASLKHILDKSSIREDGVSTLLILSSYEENAAKLARCLLGLVNTKTHKDQVPTEIDLQSHRGGKQELDSNLESLLVPGGAIRAVLLRRINHNSSDDVLFDQLHALFSYCDGENPKIPHRLIIMTATSNNRHDSELRENFKTRWPKEHDFIYALMSRISGHTLYVEKDQKSIC